MRAALVSEAKSTGVGEPPNDRDEPSAARRVLGRPTIIYRAVGDRLACFAVSLE